MEKQTAMREFPVMEHYYTVQGEGYNSGLACYFIRLGGCDVGCVWCDVKDSWDATNHPVRSIMEIMAPVISAHASRVVITGGEPLMYNLESLTNSFHKEGISMFLETSGAYPLSGTWDWICVSPKKFKAPLPEVVSKANELKIVVFNKSDFEWAEKYAAMVSSDCKLFLQPEHSVFSKVIPLMVDYVKQNPRWRISLQTHKFMEIP